MQKPLGSFLGSVEFSPDVKHENTGNEEEGHHQNRNWATESKKIIKLTPFDKAEKCFPTVILAK